MLRTPTEPPSAGAALFTTRARQLLAAGRPAEVVEVCTRGLARFPNNVGGYLLLIEAYRTLGESERALNVLADGVRRTRSARLRRMLETGARSEKREARNESEVAVEPAEVEAPIEVEEEMGEDVAAIKVADAAAVSVPAEVSVEVPEVESVVAESGDEEPSEELVVVESIGEEDGGAHAESSVKEVPAARVEEAQVSQTEAAADAAAPTVSDAQPAAVEGVAAVDAPPPADVEPAIEEVKVEARNEVAIVEPPVVPEPKHVPAEHAPTPPAPANPTASDSQDAPVASSSPAVAEPVAETPRTAVPDSPAPETRPPDSPTRSAAAPSTPPRTPSLSLHVRTAPGSNLRSSNLRLIPGLEFAPLRHEEPLRQRQIAALIDEAMPEPTLPELAPSAEVEPATPDAESVPPMPAFSESGEGVVVDEAAHSPLSVPVVAGDPVAVEEELVADGELPSVAPAVEATQTEEPHPMPTAEVERVEADDNPLNKEAASPEAEPVEADEEEFDIEFESDDLNAQFESPLAEPEDINLLPGDPFPEPPATDNRQPATGNQQPAMTPLEELARRLESARIPIVEESNEPPRPVFEPSIVSDTIAEILVKQGAWAEAMKAFQMLARMKPGRHAHYQERIREMRERIAAEAGPPLPDNLSTDG